MPTSPDVQNYHIGKGIVSFKETGGSTFTDLGNCPSFVYSPTVEKKEHFQSREGIKTKDFTAITQVGATVKFTLDEITATNLAFFALGDVDTTVPGAITINGLSKTEFDRRHSRSSAPTTSARKSISPPPSRSSRPVISASSPTRMISRRSRSRPRCRRTPMASSASGRSTTQ